ncbi:MAG: DNA polymerase domain-containing protein [Nitrospirota bacterium]
MSFDDLVRMQIDIETYCASGFEFSNPNREEDRIIVISMSDNRGWEKVISGADLAEPDMIREMICEIDRINPDVMEGHNIFNFDLNYIETRARRHGIKLDIGRGGRTLRSHPSRLNIAERTITYTKYEAYGRHIMDTWMLVQMYDVGARNLESYGLKDVARHFNLASPERTYIDPGKINWHFDNDLKTLLRYALDDVRETRMISGLLSQGFFYQAQIFPYSFQNTILRGNATKIDSLFLREYIRAGESIPRPAVQKEFEGGYADMPFQGVIDRILYCDVQSLYPSIMLTFGYFPKRDRLSIFATLLSDLKDFRLAAKEMKMKASSGEEAKYFDALQSTFKILINSFYGYLGFAYGHFSDFDEAERVTLKGRDLIRFMVNWLQENGCRVIEIDTDGIYFVPPENIKDEDEEARIVLSLSSILPEGINLELAGRYRSMFSYKIKNYALLDYNDKVTIKGSGLRSRGLELFQRRFMEKMIGYLLRGEPQKIGELYKGYIEDIESHRWDKKMFVKTETLQESLASYSEKVKNKKRNQSAAYELAGKSGRNYQAGDQISYYVTGHEKGARVFDNCKLASQYDPDNPDENVEYYKNKLEELYEKFRPFIKIGDYIDPGSMFQ